MKAAVVIGVSLSALLILGAAPKQKAKIPDWERVAVYAEYQDVPVRLVRACWECERGVKGYEFGQKSINWDCRALAPKIEWQMCQAARTIRRAWIGFRRENPWLESHYNGPKEERSDQRMMWIYRTRFYDYLRDVGWAPEANAQEWGKNGLWWWEKLESENWKPKGGT